MNDPASPTDQFKVEKPHNQLLGALLITLQVVNPSRMLLVQLRLSVHVALVSPSIDEMQLESRRHRALLVRG